MLRKMKHTHLPITEKVKEEFREIKFDLQKKLKLQLSDSRTLKILINTFKDFTKLNKKLEKQRK